MRSAAHLLIPILLSALVITTGASRAEAEHLVFKKKFTPHPFKTKEIRLKTERVYIADLGYRKCGSSNTTKKPALTWEFKSDMPELVVRIENRKGGSAHQNFVIVLPNGRFLCSQKGSQVYYKDWPKGQYKMWMFSPSIGVGGIVSFEDPTRSKGQVTEALKKLPTINLSADGPNPRFINVKPTKLAKAGDVGIGCDNKPRQNIMPLAKLKVTRASTYWVDIDKQSTFIVTEDNKCAGRETQLSAGTHTLWLRVPHGAKPAAMILETDDRKRPRAFEKRPVKQVTALNEPMIIPGQVRMPQWWGSRRGNCGGAARSPDFFLKSDKPLQKVTMSLLWGRKRQHLHVFGPLSEVKAHSSPRCSERGSYRSSNTHKFDILEGTYAVWVGDGKNANGVGGDYHVLLRRDEVKIDPLTALAPPPEDLTMPERSYMNHYPFFSGSAKNWELLFTRAPKRMFVFARVEIKERDSHVRVGEPLLIGSWGRDTTTVRHYDGSHSRVKTKLLTTKWADSLWLPKKPTFKPITRTSTAISDSGPEDKKAIAAYNKVNSRYRKCWSRYMSKNDPTWGKGHDVYKVNRRGKVTNVSDQIAKRADRKCGARGVDRAEKKLVKKLNASRKKRLAGHLKAVRARFGL